MTIQQLVDGLRRFDRELRQNKNKQVFSVALKQQAKQIVDHYFRESRKMLIIGGIAELEAVDSAMQRLLDVSQKNSAVATYRSHVKALVSDLQKTEKESLLPKSTKLRIDTIDRVIIAELAKVVSSAARSYEQAILDLQTDNRLSWRGPATDLRESLRETLDYLAPDDDVVSGAGFKLEKDRSGPTMKQKVRYILRKRGVSRSVIEAPESATAAVDELVGTFIRGVYSRSNVSTHTPTDRNEVLRVRGWVRAAFSELLQLDGASTN